MWVMNVSDYDANKIEIVNMIFFKFLNNDIILQVCYFKTDHNLSLTLERFVYHIRWKIISFIGENKAVKVFLILTLINNIYCSII